MKKHLIIPCLVFGIRCFASASADAEAKQPAAQIKPVAPETESGKPTAPSFAAKGLLRDLKLDPGTLPKVVEQVQKATAKAAPENTAAILAEARKNPSPSDDALVRRVYLDIVGRLPTAEEIQAFLNSHDADKQSKLIDHLLKEQSMPTVVFGPGTSEARISAALRLADVRPLDALAVLAAAAGCSLQPIHAPPQTGEEQTSRIVAYCFVLAPGIHSMQLNREEDLARIGVELGTKDGNVIISEIVPNSPADRIKTIKPGDRLLRVSQEGKNDVDVTGLPLEKVAEFLRGASGTVVKLTLLSENPNGAPVTQIVSLKREKLMPAGTLVLNNAFDRAGGTTGYTTGMASSTGGYGDRSFSGTGTIELVPNVTLVGEGALIKDRSGALSLTTKPLGAARPVVPATASTTATAGALKSKMNPPLSNALAQSDSPSVRIYALGAILSGNEEERKEKEEIFRMLVTDAIDLAELNPSPGLKLYFHDKSRVLVAKASARQHEIIDQAVTAMKEIDKLVTVSKENEFQQQSQPKKQENAK